MATSAIITQLVEHERYAKRLANELTATDNATIAEFDRTTDGTRQLVFTRVELSLSLSLAIYRPIRTTGYDRVDSLYVRDGREPDGFAVIDPKRKYKKLDWRTGTITLPVHLANGDTLDA